MDVFEQLVLENMTILYVENDNVTRAVISNELKKYIKHLYTAKTGEEALAKFIENKPKLVVSALDLPDISGKELFKALKTKVVNCPLIITSSNLDTKVILELVDLGIEKYMIKPVDIIELLEAIIKIGKKYIFLETEKYRADGGILLDKEKQKEIENLFRGICTNYMKNLVGKGPRKVDVVIKGREIEVSAIDSLTQIEKSMLKCGYDYKMINLHRDFLYNTLKEDIEQKCSEACNLQINLKKIEVNSKLNYDKITFTF